MARLAAFGCLTLVLFAGVERHARGLIQDPAAAKYAAMFAGPTYDDLVLGSSHGAFGIDPRQLDAAGFHAYNFSYQGSNPLFFEPWYRAYRRYHPAPKRLLFAVDWFMFTGVQTRRFEHDSQHFPWSLDLALCVTPGTDRALLFANVFAAVKYRNVLENEVFHQAPPLAPERILPGASTRGYEPVTDLGYHDEHATAFPPQPGSREAFERLLDAMQADGVRLAFVETPEYLPAMGEHPAENAVLAAIAAQRHVPFLNYNGDRRGRLNQERGWFCSRSHLNDRGGQHFSRQLARDLVF